MKVPAICLSAFAALVSYPSSSEAFAVRSTPRVVGASVVLPLAAVQRAADNNEDLTSAASEECGDLASHRRRQFLSQSVLKATAAFGAYAVVATSTSVRPAYAAGDTFEDLSMPTEAEQKQQQSEEDAMAARIRLKAELKKKAADPKTFTDSLRGEQQKQKEMSKRTKEEQRAALCEELGRGC